MYKSDPDLHPEIVKNMQSKIHHFQTHRRTIMTYNYSRLLQRIEEICGTVKEFSLRIGKPLSAVNRKLINRQSFTTEEIRDAARVLRIRPAEIDSFFFVLEA